MQIKNGILIVLISGVGTALAMSVTTDASQDKNTANFVGVDEISRPEKGSNSSARDSELTSDAYLDLSLIKRTIPKKLQSSQLFQSKSWYKAPPSPPIQSAPVVPVLPSAPALPFAFVGRMVDGDVVTLFLVRNNQPYAVKVNDIIDSVYQIDAITDHDADMTYLPMKISQKLVFDSSLIERQNVASQAILPKSGAGMLPSNAAAPMLIPMNVSVSNR